MTVPRTLTEAGDALRAGTVTSVELTQQAIERANLLDERLGVYLHRDNDAALAAAAAADEELAAGNDRGPLHGIPIGVKDILATEGSPTTAQSLVLDPAWGNGGDAAVVARLRAAGAVLTGKTTTMEFAIGLPDPDKPFPIPRNPWSPDRWAGGSSSGSASGVAAGLFLGAIGTDTGGSIRLPSALCGVTGIKPTYGRVPKHGVVPLAWSLDHVGPIARTARDCAVMLGVLAGHDARDPASVDIPVDDYLGALEAPASNLRVAVLREHHVDSPFADPVAVEGFERAIADLAGRVASVTEVTVPGFDVLVHACNVLIMGEAFAYHRENFRTRWNDYGKYTRLMVGSGILYSAPDLVQADRVRKHIRAEVLRVLDTVDVVVTPTSLGGAPLVDGLDFASMFLLPIFTPAWNALGLPAISMPCGFTADGLPLGLQIAGKPFDECTVLGVADAYQQCTDWHQREPEMSR